MAPKPCGRRKAKAPSLPPSYAHKGLWLASFSEESQAFCGEAVLSKLTGESPKLLSWYYNEGLSKMSDETVLKVLADYEYTVLELTPDVKMHLLDNHMLLSKDHLILIKARLTSGDNSWLLYHDDILYHNREILSATFLSGFHFHFYRSWVLYHPRLAATQNVVARLESSKPKYRKEKYYAE